MEKKQQFSFDESQLKRTQMELIKERCKIYCAMLSEETVSMPLPK